MRICILTLFPEVVEPYLGASILGRAREAGIAEYETVNFRDFADNRHRKVDDRPYGGGPGMVLACDPIFRAVESVEARWGCPANRVLLSPQGERLTQALVRELAGLANLLLIAGHYEGFDERIRDGLRPREISVGDYVLTGGELPALILADAVTRLLPGALGHEDGAALESFSGARLDYPHYTRPREYRGMSVPDVLISGHHAEIEAWRAAEALEKTRARRPDLLDRV